MLIWTSENVDHLLTFNENKQFKDFIAFGSSNSKMNNFILCFDEDYYKIWDIDNASMRTVKDFTRNGILDLILLADGRKCVVTHENGDINLFNMITNEVVLLMNSEEENLQLTKIGEFEFLISVNNEVECFNI